MPMLRSSDDGAVVLLSSALALVASPRMAVYVATKAAIHSLGRSLRAELDGEVKLFDVRSDQPVARGLDRDPRYRLTNGGRLGSCHPVAGKGPASLPTAG